MESYSFVKNIGALGFKSTDRIALIVNSRSTEEISRHRFSETLAINRGFEIKLFFNEKDAISWLTE
jgi:hypothetical protein